MSAYFTSRQRVKDWDEYSAASARWVQVMKDHGCTMYKVFWRGGDPDEVLVFAELPNHKAMDEVGDLIGEDVNKYLENPETEDIVWTLSDAPSIG